MSRRSLLSIILPLLALAARPAAAAPPREGLLEWKPVTFETREGPHRGVPADSGRMWVRERRDDPSSPLIALQLVRFRSTSPTPGPPILYLPGGPGGSGTRSAAGDRFELFMAMRAAGDVIAFDPRGVLSDPMPACRTRVGYPLDRPTERAAWLDSLERRCRVCAETWSRQGIDLAAYDTDAIADDVEALRVALGVPKVNLWAISYGTHLAIDVLRRHPGSIERAALAGVEGPDQTLKLPSAFDRQIATLDRMIGADRSARRDVPDLRAAIAAAIERLRREPARVRARDPRTGKDVEVTVGPLDLQIAVAENIGERHDIAAVPRLARQLAAGDFRAIGQAALERRDDPVGLTMSFTCDCASGASPARLERLRSESGLLLADGVNFPFPEVCAAWPHHDAGAAYRSPLRCDVPVLCLSGSLDVRTPPENAIELLAGLPNGKHLVIEGAGHDDDLLISSPKIGEALLAFFRGQPVPERIELPPIRFEH